MAGKKRDGGSVKVKITDDGSLKNLGKNAKKAGKDVGSVAKNVQESDRRLKSLSQQTSSSTKAFSKQAQTIGGGLVPIYATIAAQVFAVSAAFRFLQDAMETRNMVEGQKAFGAITGNAFATMTASVQAATANMISFKEAASAVAIGSAAGLTRTQLEQLGTAAKNASLALGRDVTDAFNRLIRGVTKAEPELLDELGIILRLEPATEKYAAAIGKARTELTAFERSQAVANEVITQAETKFGRITEIMDESAFVLGQFAKEFDDLTKAIKLGVAEFLIPIISFLKDNITSLIGVFGLLAAPIVSQIIPDFGKMATMFDNVALSSKNMGKQASKDLKLMKGLKGGGDIGKKAQKDFMASGTSGMQSMLAGQDMTGQSATLQKAAQGKKLNAKELGVLKRHLKQKNNMIGNMTKQDQLIFDRYIKHQELGLKGSMTKAKLEYKQLGLVTNKYIAGAQVGFSKLFGTVAKGAAVAGRAVSRLLGAFGWISLAFIAFDGIRAMMKGTEEDLTKAQEKAVAFTDSLKLLNTELQNMERVRREGFVVGGMSVLEQQANALKTGDVLGIIRQFNEGLSLGTMNEGTQNELLNSIQSIVNLVPELEGIQNLFSGPIDNLQQIDLTNKNPFVVIANDVMQAGMATKQFNEQIQGLDKAVLNVVSGAKQRPYASLIREISGLVGASGALGDNTLEKLDLAQATAEKELKSRLGTFNQLKTFKQNTSNLTAYTTDEHVMSNIDSIKSARQGQYDSLSFLTESAEGRKIIQNAFGLENTQVKDSASAMKALQKNIMTQSNMLNPDDPEGFGIDALMGGSKFMEGYNKITNILKSQNLDVMESTLAAQKKQNKASKDEIENRKQLKILNTAFMKALEAENENTLNLNKKRHTEKLDQLDLQLEVNKQIAFNEKDRLDTEDKKNKVTQSGIELRIAERVLQDAGADVDTQKKLALQDQVQLARDNLEIAEKELEIQKQMAILKFKQYQQGSADIASRIAGGSFFNSQQNRLTGFLQGPEAMGALADAGVTAGEAAKENALYNKVTGTSDLETDEGVLKQQFQEQALNKLQEEFELREKLTRQMKLQHDIANRLTEGLANDMAGALVEVAKGTKTMKQAFGDMAISILSDITKMIIKQLILNALMAMVGMINPAAGASIGALMGLTGGTQGRQGGIMQPGAGGGYRSYRSGGVADGPEAGYPATLHGTEAVVPLGNDKSIPVKMLEGSSGTNNVSVTVNMSEGGTDIKLEGDKAKAFGNSVAAAVQQEIVKQQRTGGLLSSY